MFFNLIFWNWNNNEYLTSNCNNNSTNTKCSECHNNLDKSIKHAPALDEGCINCHQQDSSKHPNTNHKNNFSLVSKKPDLCLTCHDEIGKSISTLPVVHKAVRIDNSCTNCHSPHSSNEAKLLKVKEKELCLGCHNKSISSVDRNIANIKQTLQNSKTIHTPVEEGCTVCHNPHASSSKNLLNKNFPETQYANVSKETFAYCFSCHDKSMLEDISTTTTTNFRNGNKNLHNVHVNGKKGRNCNICHNVHGSNNEHLINTKVSFGNWEMKLNYIPQTNGGSCLPACHKELKYDRINQVKN